VIPIRDTIRSSKTPVVVYALIAANVAAFLLELSVEGSRGSYGFADWLYRWALVPAAFRANPAAPREWVSVFTAMFLHGGWLHLGGNMLYLYIFGDNVEDRMGRGPFLAFYLLCGVAAAGLELALEPGLRVPMLGASGAIAGVLGAYLVLFPRARVVTLVPIFVLAYFVELPAVVFLLVWIVFQNIFPATILHTGDTAAAGGVAYWAHIGGFACGAAIALALRTRLRKRPVVIIEPPARRWSY
jgi:membrane associated rhomboid family serine protease